MKFSLLAFGRVAILLAAGAFATSAGADPAKELLSNGTFETPGTDQEWPSGWAKLKAGGSWEIEEGSRFLRLTSTMPGATTLLFQPVQLPDDVRALELTWRWRVSGLKPGAKPWFDARMMLEFRDASGAKIPGSPQAPHRRRNTEGWEEVRLAFLVPKGAAMLALMPALLEVEAGTLDLDDVALRPVDPAPLEEAARDAAAQKAEKRVRDVAARRERATALLAATQSLVTNGSCETDAKRPFDSPDGWSLPSHSAWLEEDGNHFLRLSASRPGETVLLYRAFDLPSDTRALELSWRWRISDLVPGPEAWFDARILLHFIDADGRRLKPSPGASYSRKSTAGWVERSARFLVPEGAVALEFMPALFQVRAGTFDLDDIMLRPTDPEALVAEARARAEAERAANVPPEEPCRDRWPPALRVAGNQIVTDNGEKVMLRGVNVVSLEFLPRGDHLLRSVQVAIDDWRANVIRLPVKDSFWRGTEGGARDGGAAYRELVAAAITMAANRGAYVLLDLHRFRAPREEHVAFWRDAAAAYKDHPAVLFDLFNEPHGMDWKTWRDGGFVKERKQPADEDAFLSADETARAAAGFESVGMQRLIDAVRDAGASNIVVCGGLDWAYDLSGIAAGHELDDRGGRGLVYSTHIYPWKRGWHEKVLCVADRHPVLVGEVGCDIKKLDFIPAEAQEDPFTWAPDMLGFMEHHGLHWTAFSFHPSASPVLITDWNYTPSPFWGDFVRRALRGDEFPLGKSR